MKTKCILFFFMLICDTSLPAFGQTAELSKLIEEAQTVARKTGYKAFFEFTYDFKRTVHKKDKKQNSDKFEAVCSKKRCEFILVEEDDKPFSEKKIEKNRAEAAKRLSKAESRPEAFYHASEEVPGGYGFTAFTKFHDKASYFSPNVYLKACKVELVEKLLIENRTTFKLSANDCNNETKGVIEFMSRTEALIWIDEQDKTLTRLEVYAKKDFISNPSSVKPLVVMETARIPQGYWFWKRITFNALGNNIFFPESYGDWQIEFYNYRNYAVDIEKVEVDKK